MKEKLLRTAKNISVAVRFLGEKIDGLEEFLEELESNSVTKEGIIELDRLVSDFNELYELFYNLSSDLNKENDEYKQTKLLKQLSIALSILEDKSESLCVLTEIMTEHFLNEADIETLSKLTSQIHSLYELISMQLEDLDEILSNS